MIGLYTIDIFYLVLVVPALICAFAAQWYVKSTFNKYSGVLTSYTSNELAGRMLSGSGVRDVEIISTPGHLSDNFNPKNKKISLSEPVYGSSTVAALGVACHEAGHALQYHTGYFPIKIRTVIFPVVSFASSAALPIAILGLFFSQILVEIGIVLFASTVIFQLLLLPIEFDASKRAVNALSGILSEDEIRGVKKVLTAAALTYVASALVAVANFLRILLIFNGRNRRR